MRLEDFSFFKEFPNVKILYEKRLHAKYYANETTGLLTSMNLYSYSQNYNIEFGVLTRYNEYKSAKLDQKAWEFFSDVIEEAELLYHKEPQYEKSGILGMSKKYIGSVVNKDQLSDFFSGKVRVKKNNTRRRRTKTINTNTSVNTGYCIRTGEEIPYNIEKPFSYKAYESWSKYKNEEYPENYCHFSGEPSNGETSFSRPILKKNWRRANQS